MPKFSLPSGGRRLDRMVAFVVVAWIVGPLLVGWLFFSTSATSKNLEFKIDQARQDSTRYAAVIKSIKHMEARRDTIAQKLQVIQKIDAGRYIWPHIMDEISRALPQYTWLTQVRALGKDSTGTPTFEIVGRTGTNFALTEFMKDLEASPFIKNVTLKATEQIIEGKSQVYSFTLQASYEQPPADVIHTEPLFVTQEASHGAAPE